MPSAGLGGERFVAKTVHRKDRKKGRDDGNDRLSPAGDDVVVVTDAKGDAATAEILLMDGTVDFDDSSSSNESGPEGEDDAAAAGAPTSASGNTNSLEGARGSTHIENGSVSSKKEKVRPSGRIIPDLCHLSSSDRRTYHQLSAEEQRELIAGNRRRVEELARTLARTRRVEDAALVRYPFLKRGVENTAGKVHGHLRTRGTDRLSYRDFRRLCRSVPEAEEEADSRTELHPAAPFPKEVRRLSLIEKLWHDLYCVAVPALYKVDEATGDLIQVTLPPGSRCFFWVLMDLTEQARDVGILPSKSRRALEILKFLRGRNQPPPPPAASTTTTTTTTLLQDRKPNRKATKEKQKAVVSKDPPPGYPQPAPSSPFQGPLPVYKESAPSVDLSDNPPTLPEKMEALAKDLDRKGPGERDPRAERVAFADRLYTLARQVLGRVNARAPFVFGKERAAKLKQQKTRCVLTFMDVSIKVFPDLTSQEVFELMRDIVIATGSTTFPGNSPFLWWQDPKTGVNGVPLSSQASVWIDVAPYRRVRALLSGERLPTELKEALKVAPLPTKSEKLPTQVGSDNRKRPPPVDDDDVRAPKLLKSLAAVRTRTIANESQPGACASPDDAGIASFSSSAMKRPAEDVPLLQSRKKMAMDVNLDDVDGDTKSRDDDDNNGNAVAGETLQHPDDLRINPRLLLCEADIDGGNVMEYFAEFPRGLRRLFHSLNNGGRI